MIIRRLPDPPIPSYELLGVLDAHITVDQTQLEAALRLQLSFILDKAIRLFTDDEDLIPIPVHFTINDKPRQGYLIDTVYTPLGHVRCISLFSRDFDDHVPTSLEQEPEGYAIIIEATGVNDQLRPRQVAYRVTYHGPGSTFFNL